MPQTAAQFREFARLNMSSNRRLRAKMDAAFPGGWTEENLADHLCFEKTGMHLSELEGGPPPQEANPPIPGQAANEQVEARYQEYLRYFQPEAPNDVLDLRLLCENELTLERLHERRLRMLEANSRPTDLKAIVEAISVLTASCGSIQKRLGIDRVTRGSGEDAGDKLMTYIERSKAVLQRQAMPILCTSCYNTPAKTLNMLGMLIWHFQDESKVDWKFEFECPRCHARLVYTRANLPELKKLVGWKRD